MGKEENFFTLNEFPLKMLGRESKEKEKWIQVEQLLLHDANCHHYCYQLE